MATRRKRKPQQPSFIDETLLAIKNVPVEIIRSEKVAEKLLNRKLKPSKKTSVKYKSAIKNYQTAVTRYKRSYTLLQKHYKTLLKLVQKYQDQP